MKWFAGVTRLRRPLALFGAGLALMSLAACPGIGSEDTSVLSAVPDNPAYTDAAQILATYCLRCHNSNNIEGDFNGDNYELVYANRKKIEGEVDQGLMPPLSQEPMAKVDRETLLKWLRNGAPQFTDQGDGGPTDDGGPAGNGAPGGD